MAFWDHFPDVKLTGGSVKVGLTEVKWGQAYVPSGGIIAESPTLLAKTKEAVAPVDFANPVVLVVIGFMAYYLFLRR